VVYGGSGKDLISTGKGADTVYGGSGDDRLNGGDQNDNIYGDRGIDVINGGAHNDNITGGLGNDILTGGGGSDIFYFNLGSGVDTITDFTQGQDKTYLGVEILRTLPDTHQGDYDIGAVLVNVSAGGLFIFGNDPNNHRPVLIFDDSTDMLSYDADGLVGEVDAVDLMKFENVTSLSASDFWTAGSF
jgi:Ca2+-binding RTX toxin-like protein